VQRSWSYPWGVSIGHKCTPFLRRGLLPDRQPSGHSHHHLGSSSTPPGCQTSGFVAVGVSGEVVGWATASSVSDRCVYAGVVEHSVYVAANTQGQGIGTALLRELIHSTEESRHLDLTVRHLPRERSEPAASPCSWVPGGRYPRAARSHDVRTTKRQMAGLLMLERRSTVA